MTGKILIAIGSLLLIGHPANAQLSVSTTQDGFDRPLKEQMKVMGPSPYYPKGQHRKQKKLSCYFYPTLLVKQYDEGQKGAEWLSFVRLEQGHQKRCELSHDAEEHVVDDWREWKGYFMGVRDRLIFFSASDGEEGGMPFAVYDLTTGKKIFEDSAYESGMWSKKPSPSPFNRLRVYKAADGQFTLKYLRVVGTDCDLHSEGSTCWEQVRSNLQIRQTRMPVCSYYENISTRYNSSVAYPVETTLLPEPATKTSDGPIKCWPVE